MTSQFNKTNFPNFHLSASVGKFLSDSRENVQLLELSCALRENQMSLLNPLVVRNPSMEDRQKIDNSTLTVDGKNLSISPEIKAEIFKMSEELQLNELQCFYYWCAASNRHTRRTLERIIGVPPGSLQEDIPAAARHCFYTERLFILISLCELLKARMDFTLTEAKRDLIMQFTNQLLIDGLVLNLIQGISNLMKTERISSDKNSSSAGVWMKKLAESLFYICYQTQLNEAEALAFIKLVREGSKGSLQLNSSLQLPPFYQQLPPSAACPVLSLLETLCILQITLMCIFEQRHSLLDRNTAQEISGNLLFSSPETQQQLEEVIMKEKWEHKGFFGVTLLIWGIALHRSNKTKDLPIILKHVMESNTFSFLTKHFISFLPDDQDESKVFYIDVLEEITVGYIDITKDLKLPLAKAQYIFSLKANGVESSSALEQADCLEQVLEFLLSLIEQNSSFCTFFWDASHPLHHFLLALLTNATKDLTLWIPYLRLIAKLAPNNDTAVSLYHLTKKHPSRISWSNVFFLIKRYSLSLSAPFTSSTHGYKQQFNKEQSHSMITATPNIMKPDEVDILDALLSVLQAVLQVSSIRLIFHQCTEYAAIQNLFSLLCCAIPTRLKGALLQTLAVFAKSPPIALSIWHFLEQSQLLDTSLVSNSWEGNKIKNSVKGNIGIKYELEQIESFNQEYPSSYGFLCLYKELLIHGDPPLDSYRRSLGDFPYMDFIVKDIFLKLDIRTYRFSEDRWKMTGMTLLIFKVALERYFSLSNKVRQEEFQQNKSFGCHLMHLFLTQSPFLKKILLLLTEKEGVYSLLTERRNQLTSSLMHSNISASSNTAANSISSNSSTNYSPTCSYSIAFHEDCVLLVLELLELVLDHDLEFVELCRNQFPPLLVEPLSSLLLRSPNELVKVLNYIQYKKKSNIPRLCCTLLNKLSQKLSNPQDLLDLLQDHKTIQNIINGFVYHLGMQSHEPQSNNLKDQSFRDGEHVEEQEEDLRQVIMDLLIVNLEKFPLSLNIAHLLLGLTDVLVNSSSCSTLSLSSSTFAAASSNCLEVILEQLYSPNFFLTFPRLWESCCHLIYLVSSQSKTSNYFLRFLRREEIDFYYVQLQKLHKHHNYFLNFSQYMNSSTSLNNEDEESIIALRNARGWILKGAALEFHVTATSDPPLLENTRRMFQVIFSTEQTNIPLLDMFEEMELEIPLPILPFPQWKDLAMNCSVLHSYGAYKYLIIDIQKFHLALREQLIPSLEQVPSQPRDINIQGKDGEELVKVLEWSLRWNSSSKKVAASSHLLSSWRELSEVALVEGLNILQRDVNSSGEDLLYRFLQGVLQKLVRKGINSEFFPLLSSLSLSIICQLRQREHSSGIYLSLEQCQLILRGLMKAICSPNASSCKTSRGVLYSCLLHYLRLELPKEQQNLLLKSNQNVLAQHADSLVTLALQDASYGQVLWRTLALSFFDIFSSCSCSTEKISSLENSSSFGIGGSLRRIYNEGYLENLLSIFRHLPSLHQHDDQSIQTIAIFESILSFLSRIAFTQEGATALMNSDLIGKITRCERLETRPPLVLVGTFDSSISLSNARYQLYFIPCLRLVNCLCDTFENSLEVLKKVVTWIQTHQKIFSMTLKDQINTLDGVYQLSLACSLLSKIVAFPSIFESSLGRFSIKATRQIMDLFKKYSHIETTVSLGLNTSSLIYENGEKKEKRERTIHSQVVFCHVLSFLRNRMLGKQKNNSLHVLLCPPWKEQLPNDLAFGAELLVADVVSAFVHCSKHLISSSALSCSSCSSSDALHKTYSPCSCSLEKKNVLFIVENLLALFSCHLQHFFTLKETNRKELDKMINTILNALEGLENYPFLYSMSRKLKEIQLNSMTN